MSERRFAPGGDLCNCESERHGHGYPCGGLAEAGRRRVFGVGEVCRPCYDALSEGDRLPDAASPGARRRGRRR